MTILHTNARARLPRIALLGLLSLSAATAACLLERNVCEHDGKSYDVGESYKDDCNTCTCRADGPECTLVACGDDARDRDAGPTCEYQGKQYAPGDAVPSSDGCNSCGCASNGQIACTLIACGEKTCQLDGKTYEEGDTFHDALRCNSCGCTAQGVACTARACDPARACTIGDTKVAEGNSLLCADGCNTCLCNDGSWSSTDAACAPLPKLTVCDRAFNGATNVEIMYRDGDALALELTPTSCAGANAAASYGLCWNESFGESAHVNAKLLLTGGSPSCRLGMAEQVVIDLSPMREAYQKAYQTQTGEISVGLDGHRSFSYEF